jgi:cytochrome oxidase Cu insertion factor (SCO1/SenC/PrrC family)
MQSRTVTHSALMSVIVTALLLTACNSFATSSLPANALTPTVTATTTPDWFRIKMTDVRTGETFTINDFSGKVVLIETIAQWCPNCLFQQGETKKMVKQLGNPEDLILLSLDVDSHEDEASLKKYTEDFDFEWRFAVGSLEVVRALGNLYNAEYLNPPLEPMLLIDRQGNAYQLPYGLKEADKLQSIIKPYLSK